jgi:hypothetical protein
MGARVGPSVADNVEDDSMASNDPPVSCESLGAVSPRKRFDWLDAAVGG